MFTGIIETVGTITEIIPDSTNRSFWVESPISNEFKPDQSINHNGVCMTIEETKSNTHKITAIKETLSKTNLGSWKIGDLINLERSLSLNGKLDGHIVQGHIDTIAKCLQIQERKGSREFEFELPKEFAVLIIEKGSVCINGISLTVFNVKRKSFRVAIIPYTFENTNMKLLKESNLVNVEFDMIGKYVHRHLTLS